MRRLAGGALALVTAAISAATADAGVIVFSSDRCTGTQAPADCSRSLWTVRDDGSELTRLTSPPPGHGWADFNPDWSPDGRSVLFQRHEGGTTRAMWTLSLDSGVMTQVGPPVPNEQFSAYNDADWSPDGRTIVFAATAAGERFVEGRGFSSIWTMRVDGTGITRLTDVRGGDTSPRFSPDGRRIAFAREYGADGEPAVLTMNPDGGDVAPLLAGEPPGAAADPPLGNYRVAWSPDGDRFAIAYRERLYTLSREGGLEKRGTSGLPTGIGSIFSELAWSSEPGDALVFSLPMEGRPLQRLSLAGPPGPATDLTSPLPAPPDARYVVGDGQPRWRPDLPIAVRPDRDPPIVLPNARRGRVGFVVADTAGVRRVEAAIVRGVRARGARRPVWRRARGTGDLRRLVRRAPPGSYTIRIRATDALGNRTRRPLPVPVRRRR